MKLILLVLVLFVLPGCGILPTYEQYISVGGNPASTQFYIRENERLKYEASVVRSLRKP